MFAVKGSDAIERPGGEIAVGKKKAGAAQSWERSERRRLIKLLSAGWVTAFRVFVSGLSSV